MRFAGCLVLVLSLTLIPLFMASVPPLHDYPFHLARLDILASLPESTFLSSHYQQGTFLLPNIGMDVVILPLTRLLPVLLAGRLFLGLVLFGILTGTVALHAALHRQLSTWPLLAGFFLYNWIFMYGFLNYLLGVGLLLWAAAGWIVLRERAAAWRVIWASVMAVMLLFCHLTAFGLFGIVIAGIELRTAFRTFRINPIAASRDLALATVPFVIALTLFVTVASTDREAQQLIAYHAGRGWKPLVAYRSLMTTICWLDAVTLTPLVAGVVLGLWYRRLRLATEMVVPLGLLILTFAVMPFYIFGSEFSDTRLPIAILLVTIASTSVAGIGPRTTRTIGLCALVLLSVRSAAIARDWVAADARIAAFTEAFRLVPDGATLYAATAAPFPSIDYRDAAGLTLWHPPLKQIASLASLGRDVFVPSTWTNPYTQPLSLVPSLEPVKTFQGESALSTPGGEELNAMVARIRESRPLLWPKSGKAPPPPDYLLLLYPGRFQGDLPAGAVAVARDADFVLLRLP